MDTSSDDANEPHECACGGVRGAIAPRKIMTFVLLMAWREIRASWRRLIFFFVCVAIGVGAIVALRSMIQTVRNGLTRESRALIAGDVAIGTNPPWPADVR